MSTDTFDITKLSAEKKKKKRCYSTILRTPESHGVLRTGIKDKGIFVNGEKSYDDRNYSKAGC